MSIIIDILFLLILLSALMAGAFAFYHLIYKNKDLLNDDNFVYEMFKSNETGFKKIDERLEVLEGQNAQRFEQMQNIINNLLDEQKI